VSHNWSDWASSNTTMQWFEVSKRVIGMAGDAPLMTTLKRTKNVGKHSASQTLPASVELLKTYSINKLIT
jgi:hypothetical protein